LFVFGHTIDILGVLKRLCIQFALRKPSQHCFENPPAALKVRFPIIVLETTLVVAAD